MMRTSTSEQILETAMQMAQTRGYNAFSYADISEVIGIRKASIHYHFPTKASLGKALVLRQQEELEQALQQIRQENADDPAAHLLGLAGIFEDSLTENRLCLSGMFGAGVLTLPTPVREGVKALWEDLETQVADILNAGVEAGIFALDNPPEVEARSFLANLHGAQVAARAADWQSGQIVKIARQYLTRLQA